LEDLEKFIGEKIICSMEACALTYQHYFAKFKSSVSLPETQELKGDNSF
jgi:hypothetical protein